MSYRYGRPDVTFITTKLKEGLKQKDINTLYHFWRVHRGTETKKGDYTNFISKLSPTSKHLDKTVTAAYDHSDKDSVVRNIMYCLGCNRKHAERVYKTCIVPVCVSRFHEPSNASMISVRYSPAACNDYLYFAFSTEDYAETFGLDPSIHNDDVWTVRTNHEFKELIDGSLSKEVIERKLSDIADGEYIPALVNVCFVKHR